MDIRITDDFDPGKICESGQCFRAGKTEDGAYRFITGLHAVKIGKTGEDTFTADCTEKEWEEIWTGYFDLRRNYGRIREKIPETDAFLRRAAEYGKGIRILRQDPFETLLSFIISQRKNIPSIRKCVECLCEGYGKTFRACGEELHAFPQAEELLSVTEGAFREMKLGYRAPFILDAVKRQTEGDPDLYTLDSLPDEELLSALTEFKGVGKKVASCTALFAYGRTGLSPVDTWIGQIIEKKYDGRDPFPSYGEAAGIMQQYAFFYAVGNKKEIGGKEQ